MSSSPRPCVCSRSGPTRWRWPRSSLSTTDWSETVSTGRLLHEPGRTGVIEVELVDLVLAQGAGSPPAKHRYLATGLIDGSIPVQTLRQAQSGFARGIASYQLRTRLGAEAVEFRL